MQHLGLIALSLLIAVSAFILWKWPPRKNKSFSEHVVQQQSTLLLFKITLGVVTCLYYVFLYLWLGPHLGMTTPYYLLIIIAFVAQLIVAFVPASTGRAMMIHTNAAFVVAFTMLFIPLVVLLTAASLNVMSLICCCAFILYGLLLLYLYLFVPSSRKSYLVYQISYFVSFWLLILVLTYT